MKNIYEDICNQCNDYMYDSENIYQKLFQRIYNASTSLYYRTELGESKNSKERENIKSILIKISEILSDVLFLWRKKII